MIHPINRGIVAGVLASLLAGCAVIDAQEAKDLTTEWRTATYYPMGLPIPSRPNGVAKGSLIANALSMPLSICAAAVTARTTRTSTLIIASAVRYPTVL